MKLVLAILGVALLAVLTAGVIAAASTRNEAVACMDDAAKVLQRIAPDPPNGILEEVTAAAKCVAVVPRFAMKEQLEKLVLQMYRSGIRYSEAVRQIPKYLRSNRIARAKSESG